MDSELYRKALALCQNFEPLPQGPIRRRQGTRFVRNLTDDGIIGKARILDFRLANEDDYIVVLMDRELRLYDVNGDTVEASYSASTEMVVNGGFDTDVSSWNPHSFGGISHCEWAAGEMSMLSHEGGYAMCWQAITITDADLAYTLRFRVTYSHIPPAGGRLRVTFQTDDPDTWWDGVDRYTEGTTIYSAVPPVGSTITVALDPAAAGTYYLGFQVNPEAGLYVEFHIDDVSLEAVSTDTTTGLSITTPWTEDQLEDVQFVADTAMDRMIFVHPEAPPYYLAPTPVGGDIIGEGPITWIYQWSFGTVPFTAVPAEWGPSGYPGVIEIYQGRLWLGATPQERRRLWASVAGSLLDFSLTEVVDGTDTVTAKTAIDIKVATKGAIKWLQGGRVLLVGTDLGEHSITAQGGTVTAQDLQVRDESAYGSAGVQSLNVGPFCLYVSGDRRKVRGITYDLNSNNWHSKDLTHAAEHITAGLVKEMMLARDPSGTLVLVLQDGGLVCCTMDSDTLAWWTVGCGEVMSAASIHSYEGSAIWMIVTRNDELFLERFPLYEEANPLHMDSGVIGVPNGSNQLVGLDHLEGETVQIVLDGAVEHDQVVTGGLVQLAAAGALASAGLGYIAKAVMLPREGGNASGTAQGMMGRNVKTTIRLYDSAYPLVNGDRASPDRSPNSIQGTVEPNVTEDVNVRGLGWDQPSVMTIEQDLPLRTEILAVFGLFQGNEV